VSEDCQRIEALRQELCRSEQKLQITDMGAGSHINASKERLVKDVAKNSAKSAKYGQLLYRLVKHFKPANSIELGTSLGVSASYLASAYPKGKLTTMEGCPQTAAVAQQNFQKLGLNNVDLVLGNFNDTLAPTLEKLQKVDFAFIDGNHQEEPTVAYFEACLPYLHNDSLIVFDDIHWSEGMEKAWQRIQNHPQVQVTIDLFFVGLVFLRKEQEKQHFQIRF
jgi:predicted O-methyltransferase YrrM